MCSSELKPDALRSEAVSLAGHGPSWGVPNSAQP